MRNVPSYIADRLKKNIQTRATDSAPSARIWISRPSTVLVDEKLLERQTVVNSSVTDVSIAVSHPRMRRSNASIFMAYISGGVARVVTAIHKLNMDAHNWSDTGFEENASAVSIAFDGTMPKVYGSEVEFITEHDPWVFWVDSSVLYGQKLYSNEDPVILAEENCTDVSAIRAMWSGTGGFDFGLVVFFILEGKLYYRQLIDGEWMDAEVVSYGPASVEWAEVSTFRTWDYRIGVQAKATNGSVYELFTQFMGIGKQNTEHIELGGVTAKSTMTDINYHTTQEMEHVDLGDVTSVAPYGGLYSLDLPVLVSAYNKEADDGDWGKIVVVEFNVHMDANSISQNPEAFTIVDSNGAVYMPGTAVLDSVDGRKMVLEFTDFNAANGNCQLVYSPGTVTSMASVQMLETSVAFIPENLNPPEMGAPEPVDAWNLDSEGTEIAIRFSESLVGDTDGNEDKFTVTTREYDMVPAGTLRGVSKTVTGIHGHSAFEANVDLSVGEYENIVYDGGLRLMKLTEVSVK